MGLTKDELAYRHYLAATDGEQYDIVRDRWSKLNWELLNKCDEAVEALQKGDSPAKISPLVISAGIGYDKLYAKRSEQSKPLSFPAPLLEMVRKGLRLGKCLPLNSVKTPQAVVGQEELQEAEASESVSEGIPQGNRGESDNIYYVNSKSTNHASETVMGDSGVLPAGSVGEVTNEAMMEECGMVSTETPLEHISPTEQPLGGVAWAASQPAGRGQGPPLSRPPQTTSQNISNPKNLSPTELTEQRRVRGLAYRERRRQHQAARMAQITQSIQESVPYQSPPEPGGVV